MTDGNITKDIMYEAEAPDDFESLNELDRYHLAGDVIDRVPGLRGHGAHVKQLIRDTLLDHIRYIELHGDDPPEIKDWTWSLPRATP